MSMTHDEMIAVIQAHKEGNVIEAKHRNGSSQWGALASPPYWNFQSYDYRVKPKPREFWVNCYGGCETYLHETKEQAARSREGRSDLREVIHVREVIEEARGE